MRIVTLCLLLTLTVLRSVAAATISVGGTEIEIPNPSSFSAVTPEMATLYEFQKNFVAPVNIEFLSFISEKDVPIALKNEIPDLERRFAVQTARSFIDVPVTKADFAELKQIIKSQNDEIVKKAEAAIGKTIGKINEDFSKQYDVDLALSVSQIVPLPVHVETERSLAYSAFVKYNINDEAGNPVPFVAAMTISFVHVKGKVLFLYSYAEESGLDWSKDKSTQWANAVVKANPSDFQTSINETLPGIVTGIDWGKAGAMALVGALIGLIIGLIGWIIRRGKSS